MDADASNLGLQLTFAALLADCSSWHGARVSVCQCPPAKTAGSETQQWPGRLREAIRGDELEHEMKSLFLDGLDLPFPPRRSSGYTQLETCWSSFGGACGLFEGSRKVLVLSNMLCSSPQQPCFHVKLPSIFLDSRAILRMDTGLYLDYIMHLTKVLLIWAHQKD